ncbi:MAG TPA: biopolymer transporter ExbD [Deltaproteobacteria bacterium]|nr:biopolymer transporter ExbD [Deltaproteobacteria bacterium]HXK47963.1 biopolymer transporter ExbD [Deltaproteobacteria bacterium]
MKFQKTRKDRRTSVLDVTPLVDVVFLLQIFFLLTIGSPLMLSEVNLPATISGKSVVSDTVTVIVLPEEVIIDGRQADSQTIAALPRDREIVIMASREIPYFKIMDVLDALRTSGHSRLSLATRPVHN